MPLVGVDGAPEIVPVTDGTTFVVVAVDSSVVVSTADSPVEVSAPVVTGAGVVSVSVVTGAAVGVAVGVAVGSLELELSSVESPGCNASDTSSCLPLTGSVSSPHFCATVLKEPP